MTQADMGHDIAAAPGSASGAPTCSADVTSLVGAHAERLENLYPSVPVTVNREEGLMLYRDMTLGRRNFPLLSALKQGKFTEMQRISPFYKIGVAGLC